MIRSSLMCHLGGFSEGDGNSLFKLFCMSHSVQCLHHLSLQKHQHREFFFFLLLNFLQPHPSVSYLRFILSWHCISINQLSSHMRWQTCVSDEEINKGSSGQALKVIYIVNQMQTILLGRVQSLNPAELWWVYGNCTWSMRPSNFQLEEEILC